MRFSLGAGAPPPDLSPCHAGCSAKSGNAAGKRLKTVQTIGGQEGNNGVIAQESKTATREGWLSQHSLSSALDESGTIQLPSHFFRLQTIVSQLLDHREFGDNQRTRCD